MDATRLRTSESGALARSGNSRPPLMKPVNVKQMEGEWIQGWGEGQATRDHRFGACDMTDESRLARLRT
eukprot:1159296-Pelagomonas_calceolata.AAC.3